MRILFTIGRYWPAVGGAESLVRELAGRLAADNRISVAALMNDNDADFLGRLRCPPRSYRDGPVKAHILRAAGPRRVLLEAYIQLACRDRGPAMQQGFFTAAYGAELGRLISKADLVHSLPAMSRPLVRLAAALAWKRKIPFVITPHLHAPEEAVNLREVFSRASGIIALTPVEQDWIRAAGTAPEKIAVIGLGANQPTAVTRGEFRARHGLRGPLALFLGRMENYKGYQQLLEAAPRVWQEKPETCFVFMGPPTPESQQQFAARSAEKRILELSGAEEEKAQALADCDLLCVPSTKESFGQVYLEAWAAGKPVIAADIPVERAVIEHGRDGLLVQQEPAAIAAAIVYLLKHPERAQELGEQGRRKVLERYNWETIAGRTAAFYATVIEKKGLRPCPSAAF